LKKDIDIPKVKDVYVAAVFELNEDYNTHDWNIYIINDTKAPIETVLIIAQGYTEKKMTTAMRKTVAMIPAKGFAKIEYIDESVFCLDNFFTITYFLENKMYDKRFEFPRNTIKEDKMTSIPVMSQKGILAL
jgi:hypothetical protein